MKFKNLVFLLAALAVMFVAASVAHAATVRGTPCNDWSLDKHVEMGNPRNDLCNNEDLLGTPERDKVFGRGGWDYIATGQGNDYLEGGNGMDAYYGGQGDDVIKDTPRNKYQWGKARDGNHDHAWMGAGDDRGNISDGYDEPGNTEIIAGGLFPDTPNGNDFCILDNHVGDKAHNCDTIRVMNEDKTSITWKPNADSSNTPAGVKINVWSNS